jgi:predicted nucleic acid-binding protein
VATRRLVLTDTNVLLNLAFVDRLDLLGAFPDIDFCAPREVLDEVLWPRERALVELALAGGGLREIVLEGVEPLKCFVDLLQIMGQGEAACIALAAHLGGWVASDEKRAFRREAERCLGPGAILNTPGLFVLAIRRNLIGLDEADRMKEVLERHRFKMTFTSFSELLHQEKQGG